MNCKENESEVMRVMKRHTMNMGSKDPDVIASDYAEDAVVLCSLADAPAVGRKEISKLIVKLLQMDFMNRENVQGDDYVQNMVSGEYALHVFKNSSMGMSGVENYQVRNNEIIFESAVIVLEE